MKEVAGYKFDEENPQELKEKVVTSEEFEKIKEAMELGENIRFGKRPYDAPIGKVRIWVEEDDPEE
ncbi:MAG: hypothetical protein ABEK00_00275 [Candidatus Nanohaloarchaea archaeon]